MVYPAILIASIFLLLAFAVERIGPRVGLPAVIVLVALGLLARPLLALAGYRLEGLDLMVPVIGAIGLILIVLEGALDIEIRRDRLHLAGAALVQAVAGFLLCAAVLAALATLVLPLTPAQALVLAVPFAVISSAVAIPSSRFLPPVGREFVVYESSISDILGVLVFFAVLNSDGTLSGVLYGLVGGSMMSLVLAVVCAVGLVLVLMRVEGHIRFVPLLAGLFGLYAAGKLLHLSPLIMVLFLGLLLNNPRFITRLPGLRGAMDASYDATLSEFKVLVQELTFAVRGFFFILLGYWTNLSDLASIQAWAGAMLVLGVVYGARWLLLRFSGQAAVSSLQWLAPRGLITVLLFLEARQALNLPGYINGVVVIVVLASTALVTVARMRAATPATSASAT
jgi:hypothetical protein